MLGAQGLAQAHLVDPPEVVHHPVDERHRDVVGVPAAQLGRHRVAGQVVLTPRDLEVRTDSGDDCPGLVAEVTSGPPEQHDAYLGVHVVHASAPGRAAAFPVRPVYDAESDDDRALILQRTMLGLTFMGTTPVLGPEAAV